MTGILHCQVQTSRRGQNASVTGAAGETSAAGSGPIDQSR